MKTQITISFLLLALVFAVPSRAQSPTALLQEGFYAEQTAGDLDRAIEIYNQVRQTCGNEDRICAQAVYQLGMCHLKKGDTEKAAEYFREVVTLYPEQTAPAKQAKIQLDKIKPAGEQDAVMQLITYLQQQHVLAYRKAKEAQIKLSTLAWMVSETGMKTQGGLITFENDSGAVINSEISICTVAQQNIAECYDDKMQPQQIRLVETADGSGRYSMMWTPTTPIQPSQVCTLLYRCTEEPLPRIRGGYRLDMTNRFGDEVLENFFVVLPANTKIVKGLDHLTSHQRVGPYDVYLWQDRIPENTTHSKTLNLEIEQEFSEAGRPAVLETSPVVYANDVDPETTEISATYDQDMIQGNFAWVTITGDKNFPEINGKPRYIDSRTCVLPVKLQPAKTYILMLNSGRFNSFMNTDGVPAKEFALIFATRDTYGNPTDLDPDLLKRAEEVNARNAVSLPILDVVPPAVRAYIAEQFYQTHQRAEEKGLRTNSHVHILDADWNRDSGLVEIFKNTTGQVIDHEIQMGNNDSPEMYVYDEDGVRQKIRTYKIPGGNYRYFWTPSTPIQPGEERMLFYSGTGCGKLWPDADGRYSLRMSNHYGSPVIEDFYLVLPSEIKLAEQSEPFTSSETIEGFTIYCWSKEQGANKDHRVDVKLIKP